MKTIRWTRAFKTDYKRHTKSGRYPSLDARLEEVIEHLEQSLPLPQRYFDHALIGNWTGYRDCHLFPDLLLLYTPDGGDAVALGRLGSHEDLFA